MSAEITKCRCGKTPHLQWCDVHYKANSRQYAYICECGEVGLVADSHDVALDRWNRRVELKEEIANRTVNQKDGYRLTLSHIQVEGEI